MEQDQAQMCIRDRVRTVANIEQVIMSIRNIDSKAVPNILRTLTAGLVDLFFLRFFTAVFFISSINLTFRLYLI